MLWHNHHHRAYWRQPPHLEKENEANPHMYIHSFFVFPTLLGTRFQPVCPILWIVLK